MKRITSLIKPTLIIAGVLTLAGVIAFYSLRLPKSPSVEHLQGLTISHRGERANAPENTLESIRLAHSLGARIVEIDIVATSADGVPILMHDCTVDRTTNGTGNISSMTLEELKDLTVTHSDLRFSDSRIPTLDEALDLIHELDINAEIEIKLFDVEEDVIVDYIANSIKERELYNKVHVASFYPSVLYRIRKLDPKIITAYLLHPEATKNAVVNRILQMDLISDFLGVGLVRPYRSLVNRAYVERHQTSGRIVNVWVINSAKERAWVKTVGASYSTDCIAEPCPSWNLGDDGSYACMD